MALLGGWEMLARLGIIDVFFFGQPSGIADQIWRWVLNGTARGPLWEQVAVTLEEQPDGKTKLSVRWSPHNATEVEQKTFDVSHVGMQATWGGTFDRLAAYLARESES